ncbi:MAG TPA: antibiotic biosynthesis monooxygenase [Chloroflexota bacterium]|nr:antibiotic biosynthesis monooxygenase [Chloroflexota bacterium]
MANRPLAQQGNFLHVYDFRVKPGTAESFIELFEQFDHSGENPMHESAAQVTDGVLCRDENDPDHFYLIAEWQDKAAHRALREQIMNDIRPEFMNLVEGDFVPIYADVVA